MGGGGGLEPGTLDHIYTSFRLTYFFPFGSPADHFLLKDLGLRTYAVLLNNKSTTLFGLIDYEYMFAIIFFCC